MSLPNPVHVVTEPTTESCHKHKQTTKTETM
jgi:hypothetical protein